MAPCIWLSVFAVWIATYTLVSAQPFPVRVTSCAGSTNAPSANLITITRAWAQIVPGERAQELKLPGDGKRVLRLDFIGVTGDTFEGFDNGTGKLATMFSETSDLTYKLWSTTTYACNSMFPASPLPYEYVPNNTTYCPLPAGPLAINLSVPITHSYALSTLTSTIRIVDTAVPANELACVTLDLTTYYTGEWYYRLFFWLPVVLAIGYWIASWAGRFAAGWVVGRTTEGAAVEPPLDSSGGDLQGWGRKGGISRKWGTMFVSGLSGERLTISGGLLRFVTPSLRDVIYHLQFCAILAMVAVNWPGFVYPIAAQVSWASLAWNVTLVQGNNPSSKQFDPSLAPSRAYPSEFADQMNSTASPLYLDPSIPSSFLHFPPGTTRGMESFASAVGLRPQDLFGTCLVLFLCLAAGIVAVSLLIWFTHGMLTYVLSPSALGIDPAMSASKSKRSSWGKKSTSNSGTTTLIDDNGTSLEGKKYGGSTPFDSVPPTPGADVPMLQTGRGAVQRTDTANASLALAGRSSRKRHWWRFKVKGPIGAYHYSALCGNLVRIIILFHLPITVFSVYQWSIRDFASLASVILAAIAFATFSVFLPILLLTRVSMTPTAKLYDATRTLLSLGPLYSIYRPGSQLYPALTFGASLATGIVVGAGQRSGTAQAIVLLIIEISMGLVTTIWQPWGGGSGMGIPGFLFSVLRTISTVLLLILSPAIDIGKPAAGWVAYAILLIQAFTIVFFLAMLVCKILEGLIRLFGNVRFDESQHPLDGGLFAAFGGLRGRKGRKRHHNSIHRTATGHGSINTQMMLDRYSDPRSKNSFKVEPTYQPVNYGSDYFPPQRPPSGGPVGGAYNNGGYQDQASATAQPGRGFAVIRGGKANYEDPYASLAGQTGHGRSQSAADTPSPRFNGNLAPPIAAPGNDGRRPSHGRTKSQTAVIETFPGSGTPSPVSGTPPFSTPALEHATLPFSGVQRYAGTSSTDPLASAYALRPVRPEFQSSGRDSPVSTYSSDGASTKPAKKIGLPTTWFNKSFRGEASAPAVASSSNAGSSGGWRDRLGITGKAVATPDEKRLDENALRKQELAAYEEAVRKASRDGGVREAAHAAPVTSSPALSSGGAADAQSSVGRSFVVKRPQQIPSQPTATPEDPPQAKRSFVVNRPTAR